MRFQHLGRNQIGSAAVLLFIGILFLNLTPQELEGNGNISGLQFPQRIEDLPSCAYTYSTDVTISVDVNDTLDFIVDNCVVTIQNCIYNHSGYYFILKNEGKLVLINSTFIFSRPVSHSIELNKGTLIVNNSVVRDLTAPDQAWKNSNATVTIVDSFMDILVMNNDTMLDNVTIGSLKVQADVQHIDLNDSIRVINAHFQNHAQLHIDGLNASGTTKLQYGTYYFTNSCCPSLDNQHSDSTFTLCILGDIQIDLGFHTFINCTWPAGTLESWFYTTTYAEGIYFYNCNVSDTVKIKTISLSDDSYFYAPAAIVSVNFYNFSAHYNARVYYRQVGTSMWSYSETGAGRSGHGSLIIYYDQTIWIPWFAGGAQLEIFFEYSDADGNVGRTAIQQFFAPTTFTQKALPWVIFAGVLVASLAVVIIVIRRHNRAKAKKKTPTPQPDDFLS